MSHLLSSFSASFSPTWQIKCKWSIKSHWGGVIEKPSLLLTHGVKMQKRLSFTAGRENSHHWWNRLAHSSHRWMINQANCSALKAIPIQWHPGANSSKFTSVFIVKYNAFLWSLKAKDATYPIILARLQEWFTPEQSYTKSAIDRTTNRLQA